MTTIIDKHTENVVGKPYRLCGLENYVALIELCIYFNWVR